MSTKKVNKIVKPLGRRIMLFAIDFAVTAAVYCAVCLIIYLWKDIPFSIPHLLLEAVFSAASYTLFSALFGVNSVIWRYSSEKDYMHIFCVSVLSGIFALALSILALHVYISHLYSFFALVLCACGVTFSRIFYRLIMMNRDAGYADNAKRLLIVGAGNAGSRMLDELKLAHKCPLLPVGFIDDDYEKIGRKIGGIPVLGTVADIQPVCENNAIDLIYIAIPSIKNERRSQILSECLKTSCAVKTLPIVPEIGSRKSLMGSLRDITPEELLGREPVKIADEKIYNFVNNKTVLITGGGGSIGSEICRQVAANNPKKLVLIDVYENNAYSIQQELIGKYGDKLKLEVYITTVCDYRKINSIFAAEKPDIVVHAAAHKHVPLMETVPDEAVKNNVFGTINTARAAIENKVGRMVLISTDKAVNPTNIMGATKRVCEMIIQYANTLSKDTTFTAVRFGNVLGSNGSVIPLFKKQIEARHDVTVTDPEIIRYFMTISEASQLVLTAGAMAEGGEIFILDMGEPVKIDDLAKNMIRLAGLTLGKDIDIRYIGLRPGEKLYEELLMDEEGKQKTMNEKIYIGQTIPMDYNRFENQLNELRDIADEGDPIAVEKKLAEIVPTFKRPAKVITGTISHEDKPRQSSAEIPAVTAAVLN